MRILHLTPSVHPCAGGLGMDTLGMAEAQRALGHDVEIWTHDVGMWLEGARASFGAATENVHGFRALPGLGYSLGMERAVRSRRGGAFAVVHQHGIWPMLSKATTAWRRAHGRPVVVGPQGSFDPAAIGRAAWKKRLALATYEGTNLREASALIANSAAEAERLATLRFGNPIAILPNAIPQGWIDEEGNAARFRASQGIDINRRVALSLSRIHPIKGLPLLLSAIQHLDGAMAEWIFVIAGPAERNHGEELRALAERLNILDRLRFTGALYGSAKRDAFAAAELFVLPSHSESFGIAVCEALGAGVPAIVTRGAPWSELCTTASGWWVETSEEGLAAALREALAHSPAQLREMGERGRALVAGKYTWPRIATEAVELYRWLSEGGQRPASVAAHK